MLLRGLVSFHHRSSRTNFIYVRLGWVGVRDLLDLFQIRNLSHTVIALVLLLVVVVVHRIPSTSSRPILRRSID